MNDIIAKMAIKTLKPVLTEENISRVFAEVVKHYPLEESENQIFSVINSKKDGKVYIDICGMKYNATLNKWQINTIKETILLSKLLATIISDARK